MTTKEANACGQCEECREGLLCSELPHCYYCAATQEFTLDFVDDGIDVCKTHLAEAIFELGPSGHEWPNVFEGQYPKFIKVTPIYEDLPL